MSNPADPKKPNPNQPDPNDPSATPQGEHGSTGSMFEFALPDDVDPLGNLPPVPSLDAAGGDFDPPVPPAPRDGNPFGFGGPGSRGSFGDLSLPAVPPPPPDVLPGEDAFELPDLAAGSGDSAALLTPPDAMPLEPPLGVERADLLGSPGLEPPAEELPDHAALADIDLGDEPLVESELPVAGDSSVTLGGTLPKSDAPSSFSLGTVELPDEVPVAELEPFAPRRPGSVPDISALRPAAPTGSSGSTPELPAKSGSSGSTPELPTGHRGGSSFEFELPNNVNTYSDLPPIPEPDEIGSKSDFGVLPPRPAAAARDASFDFINVSGDRSAADVNLSGKPAEIPAPPTGSSKVGLGNLEAADPVAPASGWLDAEVVAPAEIPAADLLDAPLADAVGTSDIFAGGPAQPAEPAETSDVLSATSGATPPPVAVPDAPAPLRPSDVALTYDLPPGGSTIQDGDYSDDLPMAEDAPEGELDLGPGTDSESIHDMPAPPTGHSLFDSGQLANAPDLPGDTPDYGAPAAFTGDASSILSDLSAPDFTLGDDASSVRVEAPGMDRTLGSGEHDVAFELTVPEEPLPANLFEDADAGSEPTDWEQQSGSDLLAGRTAAPGDGGPVDLDLLSEQSSLSSAPSSIFSGVKPKSGSGSGSATDPDDEYALSGDGIDLAAELGDESEGVDATVTAPPLGAGSKHRPAVPNIDSRDFELPGVKDGDEEIGQIDFDMDEVQGGEHTRAAPRDQSLSAIIRGELPDDSEELSTRGTQVRAPDPDDETRQPEVSLDYLSESTEGSALALPVQAAPSRGKDKAKSKKSRPAVPEPADAKTRPTKVAPAAPDDATGTEETVAAGKKGSGLLIGTLFGALAAGGAWAGLYFGDVIPNSKPGAGSSGPVAQNGGKSNGTTAPVPAAPGALDPQAAFAAGAAAKAVEHYKTTPPATLTEKTDAGFVRVFAKAQALAAGATAPADDADLAAARKDLEDVIAKPDAVAEPGGVKRGVKASVALGASYELAGDLKAARKVYADALQRYPSYKTTFEAHLDRLDALEPVPAGTSRRMTPAELELLLASAVLLQDAPKTDAVEPGVYYWKAVKAANAGNYKGALELIDKAKEAHQQLAPGFSGRGISPLSDPREQIFAKTCDELKAYWKLRGAVSGNPDMIAEIQKDGGALAKALDAFAKASEAAVKAEKEAVAARETVKKLQGEVTKLSTDVKATDKAKLEAEAKLEKAATDLKATEQKLTTATTGLKAAEKDVEAKQATLVSLVDVLKPVTPVPDKWGPADLLDATKAVVARATGPDLKALVPNAMTAIGGGGLAAGQLVEIAERLNKAEATAKDALAKLAAETKKLTDTYTAETKKLKDDHAGEVKKLTDTYTTDVKKLNDAHAEEVKKLKDGSAEEVKKLADKYAADSKKLTDDYAAAVAKLKEDGAAALKAEQDKTETEKKRSAAREVEFQKQLGNAVTPGQVMDLWVPVLTDLRRVSDTGPALAAAQKTIAASSPDSEDAAKGRTVAGLAYLIRGDLADAREMFQAARRSPAHKAAAGKPWAAAADTGLEAVTDPAATFRRPVTVPPVDIKAAAASLDAGITAYKHGRYDAAVKALLDAVKNNAGDPVAWYFLGAARWAQGNEEQAKKDFAQGAEREKASTGSNRATSDALTPIQGATRDMIDRARP